jgi:hypothetical protein
MGKVNQPSDVNSEIRELKRQVAELTKRVGLSSAVISRGGITILNEGDLTMFNEDDVEIFKVGQIEFGEGASYGMQVNFDNGVRGIVFGGSPGSQVFALCDETGDYLVTNDAASGRGLARPYLNYRLVPTLSAQSVGEGVGSMWPSTTSASLIGLLEGTNSIIHPKLSYRIVTTTAGGGNVDWEIRFGSDVAASGTGSAAAVVATPGWGTTLFPTQDRDITVHAAITGAATRGWIQVTSCYGTQS